MCSPICCDFVLVLLAIVFPPLPVFIKRGLCSVDSLINILLCVLGYIPGLIHSWYIIAKYPFVIVEYADLENQRGFEHNHTIYIVQDRGYHPEPQPEYSGPSTYGAVDNNGQPPSYADVARDGSHK
ncbi:hypothetical protein TRVA0_014S00518 [Trichomonascus vanleenenianus]|uniref:YqaE/Pmp3 family membrane protein n=1 Tax=Trichomonascus vanleenenianus TaxID=2268995 RepID=UPI003EC97327